VERAQLRILSESLIPQKQLEAYLSLQWSVIVRDKGTFILGDIGPIISCDERLETVSPLARQKDLKLVLLPISDRHLLIGSQLENPPILDPDTLNIGIAELSREFFVSCMMSPREAGYAGHLGVRASFLSTEDRSDMEHHLRSLIREESGRPRKQWGN